MKRSQIIGLMSGSSLDGLDIAYCDFQWEQRLPADIQWQILRAETQPYSTDWQKRLFNLPEENGLNLIQSHVDFGHYLGELCLDFIQRHQLKPDYIASHGHTIFHYPASCMTLQIGDGAAIAAKTGYPVICDFRSMDMALGGQGAPVAPLADQFLLPGYDFYLNLGGIANITYRNDNRYVAFDIGPANQVLNALIAERGLPYDDGGQMAASGQPNKNLMDQINAITYFEQPYPKSLDNRWVQKEVIPKYLTHTASLEDKLCTACEQVAHQTAKAIAIILQKESIKHQGPFRLLVSGGGAFNHFLLDCIRRACQKVAEVELIIPDPMIIEFKEAALMALMGLLRMEGIPNCLSNVTGAEADAVGGAIYAGRLKGKRS